MKTNSTESSRGRKKDPSQKKKRVLRFNNKKGKRKEKKTKNGSSSICFAVGAREKKKVKEHGRFTSECAKKNWIGKAREGYVAGGGNHGSVRR